MRAELFRMKPCVGRAGSGQGLSSLYLYSLYWLGSCISGVRLYPCTSSTTFSLKVAYTIDRLNVYCNGS